MLWNQTLCFWGPCLSKELGPLTFFWNSLDLLVFLSAVEVEMVSLQPRSDTPVEDENGELGQQSQRVKALNGNATPWSYFSLLSDTGKFSPRNHWVRVQGNKNSHVLLAQCFWSVVWYHVSKHTSHWPSLFFQDFTFVKQLRKCTRFMYKALVEMLKNENNLSVYRVQLSRWWCHIQWNAVLLAALYHTCKSRWLCESTQPFPSSFKWLSI